MPRFPDWPTRTRSQSQWISNHRAVGEGLAFYLQTRCSIMSFPVVQRTGAAAANQVMASQIIGVLRRPMLGQIAWTCIQRSARCTSAIFARCFCVSDRACSGATARLLAMRLTIGATAAIHAEITATFVHPYAPAAADTNAETTVMPNAMRSRS